MINWGGEKIKESYNSVLIVTVSSEKRSKQSETMKCVGNSRFFCLSK